MDTLAHVDLDAHKDAAGGLHVGYIVLIGAVVVVVVLAAAIGTFKVGRHSSLCKSHAKPEYLINKDISNGREQHELPALSYLRHDDTPLDFHYVTEHVQREPDIHVDVSLGQMTCCQCLDDCASDQCACAKGAQCERFYDSAGRLGPDFKLDMPEVLRECNMACSCNRKLCKNTVIQRGCQARLVLFRTKSRGWGVRTLDHLAKGTFVGVYSGELVSVQASQNREDDTYLFNLSNSQTAVASDQDNSQQAADAACGQTDDKPLDMPEERIDMSQTEAGGNLEQEQQQQAATDEKAQETEAAPASRSELNNLFVCDAKFYGNFTRFINHSCDPNVIGIRAFTTHQDQRFPHISFFTNQDIPARTELTLNYGDCYWLVKCKRDKVFCLCKRSKCKFNKKSLPMTQKLNNK